MHTCVDDENARVRAICAIRDCCEEQGSRERSNLHIVPLTCLQKNLFQRSPGKSHFFFLSWFLIELRMNSMNCLGAPLWEKGVGPKGAQQF